MQTGIPIGMISGNRPMISIVDYGLGNIFSVKNAFERSGVGAIVTSSPDAIYASDAVVLPGVGAFGVAMESLRKLDLIGVLKDVASSNKMLIGICLGMQLLMTESEEFGRHEGLGIIDGAVIRLIEPGKVPAAGRRVAKVPQVGWNRIFAADGGGDKNAIDPWRGTPLEGLNDGEFMYFVHSYYVKPDDPAVTMTKTIYQDVEFSSTIAYKNIIAFQYHPERSGPRGMRIYNNIAAIINEKYAKKKGSV